MQRSSTASEPLGLQVRGFGCPLQQRPSSGRTLQSRGGSLSLLNSLRGSWESREKPASRSRMWSRPEVTAGGGAPSVCHQTVPISETAETPTTPCNERAGLHAQAAATKVSVLHLYLPSSLCDDEEQDTETAEMRTTAEDANTQGSKVDPDCANHPSLLNSLHTTQDETITEPAEHPLQTSARTERGVKDKGQQSILKITD